MTTATAPAPRKVPTRRLSFEESLADLPRHFAVDGDLIHSHVGACLSALFPDGEDFFVRSVRHYRDQIEDPDLKRDVAGFIGQEAVHGREHRVLNDRLAELGYPTKRIERFTKAALGLRERIAPASSNLAATAALEHFTATLAELLLTNEETRNLFGDPAVRELFVWHALEESEHKAVAFDVYEAVGGGERMRVWTMKALRYAFLFDMVVNVSTSLLGDKATYRPGTLRRSWRRFVRSPLVSPRAVGAAQGLRAPRLPPERSRHQRPHRAVAHRAVRRPRHPQRQAGHERGVSEHLDVLIVGAGLSGIGAAHHIQTECPWARYAVLEARDAIGGTWDLFRYPGIRSDSDMFTLGYPFRPWDGEQVDRRRRLHPPLHHATPPPTRASIATSGSTTASCGRRGPPRRPAGTSPPSGPTPTRRSSSPAGSSSPAPATTATTTATSPTSPAPTATGGPSSTRSTGPRTSTSPTSGWWWSAAAPPRSPWCRRWPAPPST